MLHNHFLLIIRYHLSLGTQVSRCSRAVFFFLVLLILKKHSALSAIFLSSQSYSIGSHGKTTAITTVIDVIFVVSDAIILELKKVE